MTIVWQTLGWTRVFACPAGFWTLAQEYVPGSRLLRIRTLRHDQHNRPIPMAWNPSTEIQCGPDGDHTAGSKAGMICGAAAYGALIGKIGGSTGDLPDTTPGNLSPYGSKKVFAVGTDAIVALPAVGDGGPLFLSMNDVPKDFPKHSGELLVLLEYYPL
jgi:hypothetical protein